MTGKYILLFEYSDHDVQLAKTKTDGSRYVVADEENKHLLVEIGQRLMEDRLIVGYQLAQLVGEPVKS